MAILVDNAYNKYGRMKMCHMVSTTSVDQLHSFAKEVGLKRDWFQDKSIPHYDISISKRKLAVEFGAMEVTPKQLVSIYRITKQLRDYDFIIFKEDDEAVAVKLTSKNKILSFFVDKFGIVQSLKTIASEIYFYEDVVTKYNIEEYINWWKE